MCYDLTNIKNQKNCFRNREKCLELLFNIYIPLWTRNMDNYFNLKERGGRQNILKLESGRAAEITMNLS